MDSMLRKRAANSLVPDQKVKDVLYVILLAKDRVITLIRPKKHSIHPADIHILVNTISAPSIANSPASASWIPICLPKFNPSGYVNAYISFLRRDQTAPSAPPTPVNDRSSLKGSYVEEGNTGEQPSDPGIALVCISGNAEFDTIRGWCDSVTQKLESDGTLEALSATSEYSVSELGIPGLRHFVYKSRAQVQMTMPVPEDPYDNVQELRRLITLYQLLHDNIHAKSGQESPLKLQYIKTEKESVMGWITQPFELYITLSPLLPKSAAINAANAVVKWVKREENKLFLKDAPVF